MMKKISLSFDLDVAKPFFATKQAEFIRSHALHLVGFCYDGTTSFRPGSRFGPDALRDASFGLETYSPYLDKDIEHYDIFDIGNIPFYPSRQDILHELFEKMTNEVQLQKDHIKFVTLGGEHSISYSPIKLYLQQYPDLVLLHLDAHTDLREHFMEDPLSHASVIKRCWKLFQPGHELIQYGIRSGMKEEFDFMKKHGTLKNSLEELCSTLEKIPATRPIYLTLDLDFFDPAFLPGTGTPEAGGENFHNFMKILKILNAKNFVGADIVELSPQIDSSNNSSCFASKVTREVLLALAKDEYKRRN